jgi:hypothetical protein
MELSVNGWLGILQGFFRPNWVNWEIYLNGRLLRGEMHLDETEYIRSRRSYRKLVVWVDDSLFMESLRKTYTP